MDLQNMSETIQSFFLNIADNTAKKVKFVQRKSKLTGSLFLQLLIFGFLHNPKSSLNDLSEFADDQLNIDITPQGIDERINGNALSFIREMFNASLNIFRHKTKIPLSVIEQFSAVNITDSTGISLPKNLSDEFPGSGGTSSKAALKLQLVFDFLTGCFKTITMTDGITPDQKYKEHADLAEPGSLNLFDLGYFSIECLQRFVARNAYFLSRLLPGTGLYTDDGKKVDLFDLLRSETRNSFELPLLLGKIKLNCRVCFFRVPEEIANLRRSNARKQAARKGRTPSKKFLELMNWSIFITNVPVSMLSLPLIPLLYSVRWQIELIFKLWKSHMSIHKISGFRRERILVELYAKLIGLVLFQFVAMPLRHMDIDLSFTKMYKRFCKKTESLVSALASLNRLSEVIDRIRSAMLKFGKQDKRKKKLSTCRNLLIEFYYYA
jgi:hypothetical protein